jgi:outer membrane protein
MKPLVLFLLVITSTIANKMVALGQQAPSSLNWSIAQCFQYATANNIQITTSRLNALIAEQNTILAQGQRIPTVLASAINTFTNANNDITGNGALTNQLSSNGVYSVNASIILWNDGFNNNTIQQRHLQAQVANLAVQQLQNSLTLLITQAFLNILLAKENLIYINDVAQTSAARVQQGQLLYNGGSIAKNNLLQLQAQLASDKYLVIQTQNAILQNTLLLKQILQLPSESAFDILTPDTIMVTNALPLLTEVQALAQQAFPDIKIGQLGIDIAAFDISKAKAGFKPVLSANASLGTGYNDVLTNNTYTKTGYFTQTSNNFYQRIGATLAIPIFSNHLNQTNLAKANIGYKQANLYLQNYQLVLSQAIEQAYLNASNALQAYVAANQQLVAVTESYRITNEEFTLGGINSFDVLLQRNLYIQAVQAFTQAKYTAVLQQKIYQFYMGNPVVL